jgi:nucleolar protein 53
MPVLRPRSGNPDAPQQYKQPSRKGKKAWRKNVDISEVQQGLEELTDQIIKGYVVWQREILTRNLLTVLQRSHC